MQLSPESDASTSHLISYKKHDHPPDHPKPPANSNNSSHSSNDTVVEENEAYIDAGEFVVLDGNMTDTHKQDALASSLFAQFAADYKYSRTTKPKEWTKSYGVILGQIGWVLEKNSFEDVKVEDVFVVSEIVLKQFVDKFSQLDDEVLCYLRQFLNKFEELDTNNQLVTIFYNKSYSNGSVNFAVSSYDVEVGREPPRLFSCRVYFDVCETSRSFLFHLFVPECVGGKIHIEISQYKLSEGTYSKVRKTILEKLGTRMKNYVMKMKPS